MSVTGCNIMANSNAADAITAQGAAKVTAPCLLTVGGVSLTDKVTLTSCKSALVKQPKAADPFSNLPIPATSKTCASTTGSTLSPGTYCGGLSLKGNITLSPGTYVIDGGSLKINASANITGNGVTLVLKSSATADFNGNATINLSAPTTGTYAGMLILADKANSGSGHKFNGTATSQLTGTIYSPSQSVDFLGNFGGKNGCTQIVAKTIGWNGNTAINANCSAYGMKSIAVPSSVKLTG